MKIGRAIKETRKKCGLTQGQFAKKLDISQSYLSLVEGEKKQPSLDLLNSIAHVLKVPMPIIFLLAIDPSDFDKKNKHQARLAYQVALSIIDILNVSTH